MKILYVEDEPNDANLVSLYMGATAHDLTVVSNMNQAKVALSQDPGLILIDVMLGSVRGGYKLARELRQEGFTKPLIAVTALSTPKDEEDCRQAGFDYVLVKPFTIPQLANVISTYAG